MNEREKIIRLWFDMWIKKADLGIDNIFTDDVSRKKRKKVIDMLAAVIILQGYLDSKSKF